MSKRIFIGIGIVAVVILAVTAYILRPTAEATAPIEAIPVEIETDEPETAAEAPAESAATQTPQPEVAAADELADDGMADEAQAETAASEADAAAADHSAPEGLVLFEIVPAESEARFTMDELLRGAPTTVIGATDQVAGEIAIDVAAPANSRVGTILVNARTLVTDNDFRNRAINNEILQTGQYEFITFEPTALVGFPENPQIGEALSFQIVGNLTIRDITHEFTFDAIVTVVSEDRLEGYASTMVPRADYDLKIPSVPSVAEVDEEVLVEIEFVALRK